MQMLNSKLVLCVNLIFYFTVNIVIPLFTITMTPDERSATKDFSLYFLKTFLLINVVDQQECVLKRCECRETLLFLSCEGFVVGINSCLGCHTKKKTLPKTERKIPNRKQSLTLILQIKPLLEPMQSRMADWEPSFFTVPVFRSRMRPLF